MAGHGPGPTIAAVERQLRRGITHMLPTEDAIWSGEELQRRFGLPSWQFTLSATDANRFAIRLARHISGRSKVVVHDQCYHGSVDETFAVLDADGRVRPREGLIGAPVDVAETTRVVDFNDVDGLARALADRDVAAVLIEPALTNIGIVLPEPGYHDAVRELTRQTDTILIIDETHTICAGPAGATGTWGLEPDMLVIGKTIGGGIPAAAYGMSRDDRRPGERVHPREGRRRRWDRRHAGGLCAVPCRGAGDPWRGPDRCGLRADAPTRGALGTRESRACIRAHQVPWHVTRLGARAEYHFMPEPPRTGAEQAANADPELERFLHLWAMNRRVLMTPFHNMALMSPVTVEADVDRHTEMFEAAVVALFD